MNQETKMHEEMQKQILDSGARREFRSGAVRDISDDKGDTSLLPFDTIEEFAKYCECHKISTAPSFSLSTMMQLIEQFRSKKDIEYIYSLLISFINQYFNGSIESAIIGYSQQLQGGSRKYKKFNWCLGLDTHCFLDSGIRHGLKVLRGDQDEPHDRAFVWNFMGLLWTIKHHPELDDILYGEINAETIQSYHQQWCGAKKL